MTELKRALTRNSNSLKPGEYMPVLNAQTWVAFKCPSCSSVLSVTKHNHYVDYEGMVSPALKCPHNCGFSDLVCLADWIPEPKGSA